MSEASSGLDNVPQNNDQVKRNKTSDKSLKNRLKNVAGKAILRVPPLVAVLTSGTIDTPHFPAPEPTPAIAQAPDFKSETDYTLIPSTPQPPAEIPPTLTSTPEPTSIASTPSPTEMPTPTIPPTPTQEVKATSQPPQQEQSEKKELTPYSPSITVVDFAPSVQTEGLIQKEFISNENMMRDMFGDKYITTDKLIQEFGPHYKKKWSQVVEKYPQTLANTLDDIYFKHGENVVRIAEDTLSRSELKSTGINVIPLQKAFDKDSATFIMDSTGNLGISLNFDSKRIIELLKNDPSRVINASFQVGNVELFQEVHKQLGAVREYEKFDDPRRYPLTSVFEGGKVVYYPGAVSQEKNGIYTGRYIDAEGNEVEPITLEDFESGRVKNPELKIVKFNEISIVGAYVKERALENLPKLFEICNAYPDKFFVFALGNEGEDIREAMEMLKGKVPNNLLIVGQWIKYDYGFGVYEGPLMEYGKYGQTLGPDIYVYNEGSGNPNGSSFSAPEIAVEIELLLKKGLSFEEAKAKILTSSDIHSIDLPDGTKYQARVFNPSKLREK